MSNGSPLSLPELERRIAIARDNIRQLIEQAVRAVTEATTELLAGLPPRNQPPPTLPPLRRIAARKSVG